ncbi:unnamed protein product, partial [Durusdinium trenchii]
MASSSRDDFRWRQRSQEGVRKGTPVQSRAKMASSTKIITSEYNAYAGESTWKTTSRSQHQAETSSCVNARRRALSNAGSGSDSWGGGARSGGGGTKAVLQPGNAQADFLSHSRQEYSDLAFSQRRVQRQRGSEDGATSKRVSFQKSSDNGIFPRISSSSSLTGAYRSESHAAHQAFLPRRLSNNDESLGNKMQSRRSAGMPWTSVDTGEYAQTGTSTTRSSFLSFSSEERSKATSKKANSVLNMAKSAGASSILPSASANYFDVADCATAAGPFKAVAGRGVSHPQRQRRACAKLLPPRMRDLVLVNQVGMNVHIDLWSAEGEHEHLYVKERKVVSWPEGSVTRFEMTGNYGLRVETKFTVPAEQQDQENQELQIVLKKDAVQLSDGFEQ